MFKVGDLVKLNAGYNQERHPPMFTYGFVTSVENLGEPDRYCKQLVKVEWAHERNDDEQTYMDHCLTLEARA